MRHIIIKNMILENQLASETIAFILVLVFLAFAIHQVIENHKIIKELKSRQ